MKKIEKNEKRRKKKNSYKDLVFQSESISAPNCQHRSNTSSTLPRKAKKKRKQFLFYFIFGKECSNKF
jgi:hypothetical protein